MRNNGLSSKPPEDPAQAFADMLRYHEARKAAFRQISDVVAEMEEAWSAPRDLPGTCLGSLHRLISFAHVRAAFRRRVVGPMMAAALNGMPSSVRQICESTLIHASSGLFTETTHCRDIEYRAILAEFASTLPLREQLLVPDVTEAWALICKRSPRFARRIHRLATNFKLERSQSDRLEERLSMRLVVETLRADLTNCDETSAFAPLFTRTLAGFRRELESLRARILEADATFDFERFSQIMILAREEYLR